MPRPKKQTLKQRKDGRYVCRYNGKYFYGATPEEAFQARDLYRDGQKKAILVRSDAVGLYAVKWLERTKIGVTAHTYNEAASLLEKLLKHLATRPLNTIKPSDIKAVYSTEFNGLSDSYIRTAAHLYRGLFDAALADGLITYNPARDPAAKPHKGTIGGHRAITPQERQWINTLCLDHRCRPAVMAMLYEGLRPPEAKAFNIDDSVDFESGTVRLVSFAHKAPHSHYVFTEKGKTPKASRTLPLFAPFRDAVTGKHGQLVPTARGGELTLQAWRVLWQSYVNQMEREINGMDKRWYRRTKAHKAILARAAALREMGLTAEAEKVEAQIPLWIPFTVRPYDLRHSFCTFCRDAGIEINTCIQWMGHTDAKMILKVYDEVSPERVKTEAEKLEKSLIRCQNGGQK